MITNGKIGRADQIPHIFDKKQFDILKSHIAQGILNHISIKVAATTGVYLNDRHTLFTHRFGIYA